MPDVSVTITPVGSAYQTAREIIAALGRQCPTGACANFEPHITLQYVREVDDVDRVAHTVEPICRATRSFEIRYGVVGSFPDFPGIHVELEPSPALIGLYVRIKSALRALNYQTYAYDETTWRPHLTLSCRHWPPADVEYIRSMFGRIDASFWAERVQISRLDPEQGWVTVRDVRLAPAKRRGHGFHQAGETRRAS